MHSLTFTLSMLVVACWKLLLHLHVVANAVNGISLRLPLVNAAPHTTRACAVKKEQKE